MFFWFEGSFSVIFQQCDAQCLKIEEKVSFYKIASEASKLEFSAEFQIRVWSKN